MRYKSVEDIGNATIRKQISKKLNQQKTSSSYSKYKNEKTIRVVNNKEIKFDSKAEAKHYDELKLKEKAGLIHNLDLQPSFLLIDSIYWNNKKLRKISYIADFIYTENNRKVVVDVKGYRTDAYNIKKRLFLHKYPEYVFIEID